GGGGGDPAVGLQCLATASCAAGQVCCLDGTKHVASCAASCSQWPQLCDPGAADAGCLQGQCQPGGLDQLPPTQGNCNGG
ncbi:MAG: hypothetical protein ACRELB_24260, partial [Polyangiaceae bacterium]